MKTDPLKWADVYGYPNIRKQSPRITKQRKTVKVLLLGESLKGSIKKAESTRKLGLRLRKLMAMAHKTGDTRKTIAIRKLMRQRASFVSNRASFLRSMFRD